MNKLEINKAVAEKLGYQYKIGSLEYDTETGLFPIHQGVTCFEFNPVRDWGNAGPLIEKHKICLRCDEFSGNWYAKPHAHIFEYGECFGKSALEAAMLCFLSMEVPHV